MQITSEGQNMKAFQLACLSVVALGSLGLIGCGGPAADSTTSTSATGGSTTAPKGDPNLKGTISVDGSSTVFKASEAVAADFMLAFPGVNVEVSFSGTGGGFKKFGAGETDISNASRPIKQDEIDAAKANNIDFFEVPIGYDGLTVVVHPENTWATQLTVVELKKIWEPTSTVKSWKDVRPGFPDVPIKLYGPGTSSGTFDYFTKVIVGKEKSMRTDFQASEDDNVILTGVAGDKGAIGYFGLAYYEENKDKLTAVAIDNGNGPVAPSKETVTDLSYQPLSRPEFMYVKAEAYARPEVKAFVEFFLGTEGQAIVSEVGYVPFETATYDRIRKMFESGKTGSIFQDSTGKPVEAVLEAAGF